MHVYDVCDLCACVCDEGIGMCDVCVCSVCVQELGSMCYLGEEI